MSRKIGVFSPTDDWRGRAFVTVPLRELAGDNAATVKRVREFLISHTPKS